MLAVYHHPHERIAAPLFEPKEILRLGALPFAEHEDPLARLSCGLGSGRAALTIATVAGHRRLPD
jgi:hypothetical protein